MSTRLARCAVALLLAVTVSGCGGEQSPKAAPTPRAGASPTVPPGLDAVEPARPETQAETSQSALEYGRYFARLVQYAIETRDSGVVNAEAFDDTCANCASVTELITELKTTGFWHRSEPVELGKFRVAAMDGGFRVSGDFIYPLTESVELDGSVASTDPAAAYHCELLLKWGGDKEAWRVLDFVYQRGD